MMKKMTKTRKICKNCKYGLIREKKDNSPDCVCMKRTNFEKGSVYLICSDEGCRNYFEPREVKEDEHCRNGL